MAEALRRAGQDSSTGDRLLKRADSLRVVEQMSWRYHNAALDVASLIGAAPRQTVATTVGGNSPQMLINETCLDIAAGRLDVALLFGAEAIFSRRMARRRNERLPWPQQPPETPPPDQILGIDRPGTNDAEQARSLSLPTQVYPIFECALRAAAGETIEDHQIRISELWARFSEVAATNPYAWSPKRRTPVEIRTVSADNRMVGFPYTKLMNANLQTDQAAAVIVCSLAAARAAGVPDDHLIFPWAGADAHDRWYVSERRDLHSSPAIAACGKALRELSGVGIDDVNHVDLYSCFPSAVQMAAAALDFPLDDPARPPTVTGGLSFAGGPGNNYVGHSIATMAQRLRHEPGTFGLVSALGWYVTKHSLGLYSTTPPPTGFRHRNVQGEVDALGGRQSDPAYAGPATVEAYTVMHERDGQPAVGIVAAITPSGARTWANTYQPAIMKALVVEDVVGRPALVSPEGLIHLS